MLLFNFLYNYYQKHFIDVINDKKLINYESIIEYT